MARPWLAATIVAVYIVAVTISIINFPELEPSQKAQLKIPRTIEDAKLLRSIFSQYTDTHYSTVITAFTLTFLTLQSFCIPGTIFLSFLSGALFGFWVGFPLTIFCSTVGASSCFMLSSLIGSNIATRFIPGRMRAFQNQINKHRDNLFNYLLFLRISPLLPNWFINLTCPLLGVPFLHFAAATAIGVAPATFLCVRAGLTLQTMQSTKDVFDLRSLALLLALAFLPIIPTLKPVQRQLRRLLKAEDDRL